ncbi:SdiA-regulated domain-containing protein [Dyadobacter bucti]|uniref:SdiA-regulated domain-containing protein n=1 Tax=Dyadobacter bucti TaxID=2572203 RepID=UPI001107DA94|nr:SdiA-regulated domain-containing protein [Dyadobacter bucti]
MTKKFTPLTFLILFTLASLSGCNSLQKEHVDYKDYDLEKPEEFNMPESLFEISGIAFKKGNSDTVYAVQDEDGKLFRLGYGVNKQLHAKFGKKGDYEDVSILNDQAVILKSNGILYTLPLSEAIYEEPENVREIKNLVPKGEYEGMYGDEASGTLYILCKNCKQDDSRVSVTGYIVKPGGDSTQTVGEFSIDVKQIKAISDRVERGFRPSALARNPLTSDWYIVSAVNKLLVVTDVNWKVKQAYHLSGNTFVQPEGIAFDKAGNMYISNEGDDLSNGNILKFKKKKSS